MFNIGNIVMVKRELINESELYTDLKGVPLEIIGIVDTGHKDYDKTMNETLYAFKTKEHRMLYTLYESELEPYSNSVQELELLSSVDSEEIPELNAIVSPENRSIRPRISDYEGFVTCLDDGEDLDDILYGTGDYLGYVYELEVILNSYNASKHGDKFYWYTLFIEHCNKTETLKYDVDLVLSECELRPFYNDFLKLKEGYPREFNIVLSNHIVYAVYKYLCSVFENNYI